MTTQRLNSDDEIKAAVEWFYRTRIKDPKDGIDQISKETGRSAPDIEAAIAEAHALLDSFGG